MEPITAVSARDVSGEQGSALWYAAWSRVFLGELESSGRTPLHSGRWWMVPCPADLGDDYGWRHVGAPWPGIPPAAHLDQLPTQPSHDYSRWDFHDDLPPLALRPLSAETDGRVKFWRKAFREGYLPPVLLLWISGLFRYVILDGHDRLLAALLEGHAPPLLALLPLSESAYDIDLRKREAITQAVESALEASPTRGRRPTSVEVANRLLIEAYDDRPNLTVTSQAWPLRGGVRTWLEEVRAELRRLEPRDAYAETEMLGEQ
jgi:hypothetical protein